MDIQRVKNYWVVEAEDALRVMHHLYEKDDYSYALFFGHLAIEKILKALYVIRNKEHAPYSHNLERLAALSGIELTDDISSQLEKISRYNIESRYPDDKREFRKLCTEEFTKNELSQIEEIFKWLRSMLM
ncbi:MAG: HEPN domain-containing protein [Nitrospirae bacterium]|nr:HEPN domain-containing protein [Nitrospirota bacterium]